MLKKFLIFLCISSIIYGVELKERVKEYELKNGLKVLCVERRTSPTFSVITLFNAGRVDEPKGKAGIAHLVEHMMFKGTKTIGTKDYENEILVINKLDSVATLLIKEKNKSVVDSEKIKLLEEEFKKLDEEASKYEIKGALDNIYTKHGARGFNAGTSMDATYYVISLPANKLELWARLTADIIENTVFRGFYKEKNVVMQEIRMYNDEPDYVFWETLTATAFKVHPYGKPIAGKVEDVESLTINDIKEFYKKYYPLSNAVIGIVGNVNFNDVKNVINKYFSHIPKREKYKEVIEEEPVQKEERRKIIELDAEPKIAIAYHIPTYPDFDTYVLEVIAEILSRGRTSRLYKSIVEKKIGRFAGAYSGAPGIRFPNLFIFESEPIYPHTTEEIEKIFYEEIEKLKKEPVIDAEIKKVKNQINADFLRSLQRNFELATQLVYFEAFFGDWSKVYEYKDMINKVTADDIIRVANKYFTKENRTVVVSVRKTGVEKKLIDIAIEYYKERSGKEPNEEIIKKLNEVIEQIEILEKTQGVSMPRSKKIEAIKKMLDAFLEGK